jgi:hypothetical protein
LTFRGQICFGVRFSASMAKTAAFRPEKRLWTDKARLASERLWAERPEVVKQFIDQRPDYEKLCSEVAYTLDRKLVKAGVDFSTISYRAKTLDSFLEKVQRKSYQDPISENTDFAGAGGLFVRGRSGAAGRSDRGELRGC